jgi:enolase
VLKAVKNITTKIAQELKGMDILDQKKIDQKMIELDGTKNKSKLGANAILAVSLAVAHAAAKSRGILLYSHINDIANKPAASIPMPMMNILNGGQHAAGSTDIQETMIVPVGATTYNHAVRIGSEVFQELKAILHKKGYATTVGDKGKGDEGKDKEASVLALLTRKAGG